jgi:hypothetical protein
MRYKFLLFIAVLLLTLTNSFGQSTTTYFNGGNISYADSLTTISLYKKVYYARKDSVAIENYSIIQYDMNGFRTLINYFERVDILFKAKSKDMLLGKINGVSYYYKQRGVITYKDNTVQTYVPDIILPLLSTGRDVYIDISRAYYDELQFRVNVCVDSVFKQIRAVH